MAEVTVLLVTGLAHVPLLHKKVVVDDPVFMVAIEPNPNAVRAAAAVVAPVPPLVTGNVPDMVVAVG